MEYLWVRIKGKATKTDDIVRVSCRSSIHSEEVDEVFYKQTSHSCKPLFLGAVSLTDVCWKNNTASRKQSRSFLECVKDEFLAQLMSVLFSPPDICLADDVKTRGSLGHNAEFKAFKAFKILGKIWRGLSRTT